MSQHSQAERSKAFRIRAKLKKNAPITASEREFMDRYDADYAPESLDRSVSDAKIVSEAPAAKPPQESKVNVAPQSLPDGHVALDFSSLPEIAPHAPDEPLCSIPNCPKCKSVSGSLGVCGKTGDTVWPPVQAESAEAMATLLMGGIAFFAKTMRKDHVLVMPTDAERKMFGKALQQSLNRRVNAAGAVDDIFFLLFALTSYGQRAFTAEPPKELPGANNGTR
jgi:hypothetical protein